MAPIERPRTLRISSYGRLSMRRPSKRISPRADPPGRIEQADDRGAGERLAGARFADHAEDLARRDREGDVVERDQRAAPPGEFDAKVRYLEQRCRHAASCGRGACSRRAAPRSRRGRRSPKRACSAAPRPGNSACRDGRRARSRVPRPGRRAARRPLDDDLANAGVDEDLPEQRVLAVDAKDRHVVGIDRRAVVALPVRAGSSGSRCLHTQRAPRRR